MSTDPSSQTTYADAGVDIDAGNELVKRIASACKATHRPEMLSSIGGFAALAELPGGYQQPVLVTGTDGVGTKLKLAIDHDRHDRIGEDLVAMCVNDALVCGAEPFLFLDYYATAKLDVDVAERVIKGIAAGCQMAGCALVGGETAEMPGLYQQGDYDLAGFCIGVVEKADIIDGTGIAPGDVLVGLPSSGPHSNGYSLIRHILARQGQALSAERLDALMAPTRIYAQIVGSTLGQFGSAAVHGMCHITGGGFTENLPRMFTHDGLQAQIDSQSWQWPEVFAFLQQAGNVAQAEMLRTFNCGIGYVFCMAAEEAALLCEWLAEQGEAPAVIGQIVERPTGAPPLVFTG